jgi:hypothetical protein
MTSSKTPTTRGLETCSGNHLHTGENVLCHHMTHVHGIIKDEAEETAIFANTEKHGGLISTPPKGR